MKAWKWSSREQQPKPGAGIGDLTHQIFDHFGDDTNTSDQGIVEPKNVQQRRKIDVTGPSG